MSIFDIPLPESVEAIVAKLAADPEIQAVAAQDDLLTTRNSYGRYLALLPSLAEAQPFGGTQKASLRFWAVVLHRAGANRQGLIDALRICEG